MFFWGRILFNLKRGSVANGHSLSLALNVPQILFEKDVNREFSIHESVFCGARSRVLSRDRPVKIDIQCLLSKFVSDLLQIVKTGRPALKIDYALKPCHVKFCMVGSTIFLRSGGGRVVRRCWVNFQCQGVLLT